MKNILLTLLAASALLAQQASFEIVAAYYGANDRFADVSNQAKSIAQQSRGAAFTVTVNTFTMGVDPAPGTAKVLRVYYKLDGVFNQGEWRDGDVARIGGVGRSGQQRSDRGNRGVNPPAASTAPLQITSATYGEGNRTIDVSTRLQSRVQNDRLEVQVTNDVMGRDPAPANVKELVLTYTYQGRSYDVRVRENEWLRIPDAAAVAAAAPVNVLRIVSARYGSGNRVTDVTSQIASRVSDNRVSLNVDNATMGSDPAIGADKQVAVVYEWNGQQYEIWANEGKRLELPSTSATRIGNSETPVAVSGSIADGVCFYAERDYQGNPFCVPVDQSVPRISPQSFGSSFGSLRFFGRARQLALFENETYQGRTMQVTGDQPNLVQLGGGAFFGSNRWVVSPRSVQVR